MACNLQQHQPQQCVSQQQKKNHQQSYSSFIDRIGRGHCASTTSTAGKLLHSGVACALLLQLLVLVTQADLSRSEGNVGCHFVKTLCLEESEVCFNDNIFGKCIPTTGVDVEDIEKTPLTLEQSRLLATLLEELQGAGLGWENPYVQCRIRSMLYSLRKETLLPPYLCANFAPASTNFGPAAPLNFGPIPSPYDDYTDELYYPPLKKQLTDDDNTNSVLHDLQQERQLRHDPMELAHFGKLDSQSNPPSLMDVFVEEQQKAQQANERKEALRNQLQLYQLLAASEPDPQPYQRNTPSPIETLEKVMDQESYIPVYVPDVVGDSNELYFPENYGPLKRNDGVAKPKHRSFFRELIAEQKSNPDDTNENMDLIMEDERERNNLQNGLLRNSLTPFEEEAVLAANVFPQKAKHTQPDRVYTEGGGLIYLSPENRSPLRDNEQDDDDDVTTEQLRKEKARELLANMFGFTRHERLDVKKPGPLVGPPPSSANGLLQTSTNASNETKISTKEVLPEHINASNEVHKKKKVVKDHSDTDHAPHSVDTEYTHVFVKNPIDNWSDGVRIMNELANILHMQGYFAYLTVQPREVSFRVDSNNPERKTAHDIARIINENRGVKNNILRRLGVTVLSADVGDKVKSNSDNGVSSARIELAEQSPDVTHIMAYMFAGAGAAAVIVIFVTLILIKRHDKRRDKLGGLQSGIAGAESCSKDYQDLCRARMAGKGNAVEPVASGRITSLSKENDRPSSSSRSSTSSWSEEPALTNMDISTGHMVLSYMEDHLRNKGRLQREWEALCRYEAEPSARDAALQPQCAHLNRTGAPLPYDHSRVVLNHLANAEGLDYINASTITDHDPRAPAYIAAQGPTPLTLTHFWQMIWEQGAVVIVALCRLQENGEIACARYWPEEGAEVYHIYEVHLVSEHIWCDDYLVRSFYLKNLRTSETRTVTQFHFLSWPQNGVPAQAKPLLDFRRKVNKSYRSRSCPIVVHGSAGAGRTGAYLLLDMVLGRMNKGAREIDIAATLEHLRDQRAGLVATRQQFEFVLMAVAEEVHAILKALPANPANEKRDLDAKDTGNSDILKEEEAEDAPTTSLKKSSDAKEVAVAQSSRTTKENEKVQSGKGEEKSTPTPTKEPNTNMKKK